MYICYFITLYHCTLSGRTGGCPDHTLIKIQFFLFKKRAVPAHVQNDPPAHSEYNYPFIWIAHVSMHFIHRLTLSLRHMVHGNLGNTVLSICNVHFKRRVSILIFVQPCGNSLVLSYFFEVVSVVILRRSD